MLLSDLLLVPPTDRAGATAANRFAYQLDWSLCLLLKLHAAGQDYVLILDYHDDVVVLDSASDPTTVTCYQVKTRDSGHWTAARLVKREAGKLGPLPSILGRMFRHVAHFGDAVAKLWLVSNVPVDLSHTKGTTTLPDLTIELDEVNDPDRTKLTKALAEELGVAKESFPLTKAAYQRATLPLLEHGTHCIGELARFLDDQPKAKHVPPAAFYRTLKEELSRLQQCELQPTKLVQLCTTKAATRARFQSILEAACVEATRTDLPQAIVAQLQAENVPFQEVSRVRLAVTRYEVNRFDPGNAQLRKHGETLRSLATKAKPSSSLWDSIEFIRNTRECMDLAAEGRYPVSYVRAMIGVALHESLELPGADTITQEEET